MAVAPERTVDNLTDTGRKWATTTLAERVLTAREGIIVEEIAGPGVGGTITLSEPVSPSRPVFLLVHDGAGELAAGGISPAPLPVPTVPTDFVLVNRNAQGVGELTAQGARDYTGQTIRIMYSPDQPEGTIGGQTTVTPTDL